MVSQRYLLFSRFVRHYFHDIGRYIIGVYLLGIGIIYCVTPITTAVLFLWLLGSVAFVYIIWMMFNRTYKVKDEHEK